VVARPRKANPAAAPHSQTLDRGIALLEAVAEADAPLDLDELAGVVGVHRSVAYRMIRTLEDRRLVRRTADGRYDPGFGLSVLARGVSRPLQTAALPELTALANDVGMTAFLTVRDGDESVTIASVEPRHAVAHVAYRPGTRHPVDRGAPGLALLAAAPRRTGERREVATARRRGYASSHGEVLPGLSAAAAPIVSPRGEVLGSVAVVFLDRDRDVAALGRRLIRAAAAISTEFT
jgi:DNA-binding IclR family transcriptional regulator